MPVFSGWKVSAARALLGQRCHYAAVDQLLHILATQNTSTKRGNKWCSFLTIWLPITQTSPSYLFMQSYHLGSQEDMKRESRGTQIHLHINTLLLRLSQCNGFKTARLEELFLLMPPGKHQKVLPRALSVDMYYNSHNACPKKAKNYSSVLLGVF